VKGNKGQESQKCAMLVVVAVCMCLGGMAYADVGRHERRVIVLGIDAMDYGITHDLITKGKLPHFKAIAEEGTFTALETSMPPLSPVAWTTFTTGMDPGGHGIFDFLRRDPTKVKEGFLPEDGVAMVVSHEDASERRIPFSSYVWPTKQKQILLRKGQALWEILSSKGIDCTIYKMPANFPVAECDAEVLSGMGTPDIEGTYGTYTYITDRQEDWTRDVTGGRVLKAVVNDGVVKIVSDQDKLATPCLYGPGNPYVAKQATQEARQASVPFEVYVDRKERTAAIVLQKRDVILREGEWSPWITARFDLLPKIKSISGIVRFYLQEATPSFRLFVSPVNLAPGTEGLAAQSLDVLLQNAVGDFHTKGMPEQTKAFTEGIFSTDEYIAQSTFALEESLKALEFLFSNFDGGLLFFYVSTLDLDSHVMWKYRDPEHPASPDKVHARYRDHIENLYVKMDEVLGTVRSKLQPEDILYVISDHGFVSFRQEFNLTRWLETEGYIVYKTPLLARLSTHYAHIDWGRTRGYGVGFNGVYINLKGREASGVVEAKDYDDLVEEIRSGLLAFRDANGRSVFRRIYRPGEIYSGTRVLEAPDLILGYDEGYGPSDETALGTWAEEIVEPHVHGFSGHHAVDYRIVPGVLFSTRRLHTGRVRLQDVTATVLRDFDVSPPEEMTGKALY